MSELRFASAAARRLEALYKMPDVVGQRVETLRKLGLTERKHDLRRARLCRRCDDHSRCSLNRPAIQLLHQPAAWPSFRKSEPPR